MNKKMSAPGVRNEGGEEEGQGWEGKDSLFAPALIYSALTCSFVPFMRIGNECLINRLH